MWKRLPKDIFVGRKVFEIGICSATVTCNVGASGFLADVMEKLCLVDGNFTRMFCYKADMDRTNKCNFKSVAMKNSRKRSHAIRKGFGNKYAEKEGDVYSPGSF